MPRMRTSTANWKKPLAWNAKAEASGKPWRVFCGSLCDVFDNEVPMIWRHDLWKLINATPALTWLLLTKRIGNVAKMWPVMFESAPPNIWLGATIVNQEEADRDVPKLLAVPAVKCFVSYEPALGPVDWTLFRGINWIIIGGESTQGAPARPFDVEIACRTIRQCRKIGAAPFVKQLGSFPCEEREFGTAKGGCHVPLKFKDRAGADPAEWPIDLRVQEFPA